MSIKYIFVLFYLGCITSFADETVVTPSRTLNSLASGSSPSIPFSYMNDMVKYSTFKNKLKAILDKYPQLMSSKKALEQGMAYFYKHKDGSLNKCGGDPEAPQKLSNQDWVAVTDYTKPKNEDRMFFINVKTNEVITDKAAHGSGSGDDEPIPTKIGDTKNSNKTPGGFFVTGEIYTSVDKNGNPKKTFGGKRDNGVKLRGLNSCNVNAFSPRGVVFHGATYVTESNVGDSWGCPAVPLNTFEKIKEKIDEGALMYQHTIEQDKLNQPEC